MADATAPHAAAGARPRVAVVFGGTSSEHVVSCLTAGSVVRALGERYECVGLGITPDGRWVRVDAAQMAALQVDGQTLPELPAVADDAVLVRGRDGAELAIVRREDAGSALASLGSIDVALPLLHGPFGEDGTVQGLFEMAGVRYVGSGVLASALGMDKHFMKLVLASCGLPVGPFTTILPQQWEEDRAAALAATDALRRPLFVKPSRGGSSIGISRVEDGPDFTERLTAAIEEARRHDPKVIVEEGFSDARELECGVLVGPHGPQASVVAEIRMHTESRFYDFAAKYLPEEQVDLDVPADLDPEIAARVQQLAVDTFVALGCEGLARVDFFLTEAGRLVVNEINTMPGFTEHSMFPRMWRESGLDYPELIDRLIIEARRRPLGLR